MQHGHRSIHIPPISKWSYTGTPWINMMITCFSQWLYLYFYFSRNRGLIKLLLLLLLLFIHIPHEESLRSSTNIVLQREKWSRSTPFLCALWAQCAHSAQRKAVDQDVENIVVTTWRLYDKLGRIICPMSTAFHVALSDRITPRGTDNVVLRLVEGKKG